MVEYCVILSPYEKPPQVLMLKPCGGEHSIIDYVKDYKTRIFSDLTYTATLKPAARIKNLIFYINGSVVDTEFSEDGIIEFKDPAFGSRIFCDCYGFVQIMIVFSTDEDEIILESDYISVMVRKGQQNDSVRRMADYVYEHNEEMLYGTDTRPKDLAGLKESNYKSLESRILLLERIASLYEEKYPYFKTNSRFNTVIKESIDDFNKLQYISSNTIQYIAQHPEQFKRTYGSSGIRVNNSYYQPNKTLITKNVYSFDIYENQIIVSFLQATIFEIEQMSASVQSIIDIIPSDPDEMDGYVSSSFFIYKTTRRMLSNFVNQLKHLSNKFTSLYNAYQCVLDVTLVEVTKIPKPTAIMLSVPQYRQLYEGIVAWFTMGILDLRREEFVLSFLKINTLYECYALAKILDYMQKRSFILTEARKCIYTFRGQTLYRNTECLNTYVFKSAGSTVTLYYQPVIYSVDKRSLNKIGLYRNTSISFPKDDEADSIGLYYAPDYILKIEHDTGSSEYVIIDAKFSKISTVKRYQVAKLVYKYLFSISPIEGCDIIMGICIINGQSDSEEDCVVDIYDKSMQPGKVKPYAEILTLTENNKDDQHIVLLKKVFDKYLFSYNVISTTNSSGIMMR